MTRLDFLTNLNDAQDEYIEEALSLLESKIVSVKPKPARRVFRRVFTGLIAAILILLSSFAVAMAASPEFREAVFSFFHIKRQPVLHLRHTSSWIQAKARLPLFTNNFRSCAKINANGS